MPPPLIAAAVSPATAAWAASWADGLATVLQPHDDLKKTIDAYRSAGGRGPLVLQVHLSWADDDETALDIAHEQWRSNVFAPNVNWNLDHVSLFDEASKHVPREAMQGPVLISSDPGSTSPGCRTSSRSASTRSTSTTSARSSARGSRCSARRSCRSSTSPPKVAAA